MATQDWLALLVAALDLIGTGLAHLETTNWHSL